MKKTCLSFLLLLSWGYIHAQIAQWTIPPLYDDIQFAKGSNLMVANSDGTKSFYNLSGQQLFTTSETVNSFSEGLAVLTNDTSSVLGIYDSNGNFTEFPDKRYKIANDYPYYSNGYLIVKRNRYYFVDRQGVIDKTQHLRVYPYHNGFAVCRDYDNPQKKKDKKRYLVDVNKKEVPLICNGKTFDATDVAFISSVNDEYIAYAVIKRSVYVFNGKTKQLSPLYFPNSSDRRPTQAKLLEDLPTSFDNESNFIYAQCGRNEQITICVDSHLIPKEIIYNDEKHYCTENNKEVEKRSSALQAVKENELFGLSCNGKPAIPAQFDAIDYCFGNYAIVKKNGKQGLLQVNENAKVNITFNNDKALSFRHQWCETNVRIDLPSSFNALKIDFIADPSNGFVADPKPNSNDNASRAEFSGKLAIPSTITEEVAEHDYSFLMSYDNIILLPYAKKVKAWRDNYYDVVINDNEKVFDKKNGLISFPFTIDIERFSNEEAVDFEVEATPDILEVDVQMTSTDRGTCVIPITALEEGENYMFIELTEQGCPSLSFPFTVTFNKPKGKQPTKGSFKICKMDTDLNNE